ncbi:MAG: hypothetical protein IVW52_12805 [Acidimicrobiales bacterium]|nr:hypothetical protein [Acidimicrobiales bacterium]
MTISEMRRQSYRLARTLGNVQAARRGPASYSKRVLRRNVYRTVSRSLGKGLRGFGL